MDDYNRLRGLVLDTDLDHANKLFDCMGDCLHRMKLSKDTPEFSKWYKEFKRCSYDLYRLQDKKVGETQ